MISHKVTFFLDDEEGQIILAKNLYIHLTAVTVHLNDKREGSLFGKGARVWAGGYRCRKDGQLGKGWGRTTTTIGLPEQDETRWIERAEAIIYSTTMK